MGMIPKIGFNNVMPPKIGINPVLSYMKKKQLQALFRSPKITYFIKNELKKEVKIVLSVTI